MSPNSKLWNFIKKLTSGGTFSPPIPIAEGGTSSMTASTARTALDVHSKAESVATANNLNDLANIAIARTNLGLGSAAEQNVGITPNNVVQLDGSAKLPAVDGSQLTNLGTAAAEDVGLGPNNVVQLDGSSKLPGVDGSALTNLPSGALVLLSTIIANNSSSIDFESLITSEFDEYQIHFNTVEPSQDDSEILLRTSSNNGISYDSVSGDYRFGSLSRISSNATVTAENLTSASSIRITPGVLSGLSDSILDGGSGKITIWKPITIGFETLVYWETVYVTASNNIAFGNGGGSRNSTTSVNAVQLSMALGNFTRGTFKFYGIK